MKYCEVMIGPPGSGKSTYIEYKRESLASRNPYTINLDPGNASTAFDYTISSISSTGEYQRERDVGPNMSVKAILQRFSLGFEAFYSEHLDERDYYLLVDLPGQIEFFMCSDVLHDMIGHLQRNGYSVVVVNLVDLVFFSERHALLSSYLICTLCIGLIEAPQICVISKCDNLGKLDLQYSLREVTELAPMDELSQGSRFYEELALFVRNQGMLSYEILDYSNPESLVGLQILIDRASGILFEEEYREKHIGSLGSVPSRNDIFSKYEQ
jgi:GPN-loop GTPase